MGSKTAGRALAIAGGAPVIPGTSHGVTLDEARAFGSEHGYPILLKAVAGGGGKGMRAVHREEDLEGALRDAASEAERAFRSAEVARLRFEPAGVANRHRAERERAQVRERDTQQPVRHTDDQRADGDGANEQFELPLTRVGTRFGGQRVALGEVGWRGDRH